MGKELDNLWGWQDVELRYTNLKRRGVFKCDFDFAKEELLYAVRKLDTYDPASDFPLKYHFFSDERNL